MVEETGSVGDMSRQLGLVQRDVIVVTLKDRLGVFGFPGHPALTAEGDYPEQGLLDQIAALEWCVTTLPVSAAIPPT